MSTLERAIAIAAEAHAGQRDKAGEPYILHPLRLMLHMDSDEARMAAVLHDVVEDSPWTIDGLRAEGFAEKVLAAIDALTRRPGEAYEAFVARAGSNPLARRVKLADLEDNLDARRLPDLGEEDLARVRRYHRAWRALSQHS